MEDTELLRRIHNTIVRIELAKREKKEYAYMEEEVRNLVFVPNQKISIMRKWFNLLPEILLTKKELNFVKESIVKPNETVVWPIILKILFYQKQLSTSEMKKWFNYITQEIDIKSAGLAIIIDNRINNNDLKVYIYEKLLTFPKYFGEVLARLDTDMRINYQDYMEKCFNKIVEMINKNDEISKELLTYWKLSNFFDTFAKTKNISSVVLFNATEKSQYLPKTAQDVFIF